MVPCITVYSHTRYGAIVLSAESWITQIRKGLLELCILNFLWEESLYGYEIVKKLSSMPELVISEGTIYPILSRLKKDGLVSSKLKESDRGPVRKYYILTPSGRKRIDEMNRHWGELKQSITKIIGGQDR
jgi:PadR family transcriptional regulator PadR